MGFLRAASSIGARHACQCHRRARYDQSRQFLFLLLDHGRPVAGSPLGGLGAELDDLREAGEPHAREDVGMIIFPVMNIPYQRQKDAPTANLALSRLIEGVSSRAKQGHRPAVTIP